MTTGKVVERPRSSSPSFNDILRPKRGAIQIVKERLACLAEAVRRTAKAGQLNTLQTVVSARLRPPSFACANFGAALARARSSLKIVMVKPHG